jgi:hypothetical protein
MSAETKTSKRQVQQQPQQLQPNISLTLSDESYPWRSWQANHFDSGRKDIESWWISQFQTST